MLLSLREESPRRCVASELQLAACDLCDRISERRRWNVLVDGSRASLCCIVGRKSRHDSDASLSTIVSAVMVEEYYVAAMCVCVELYNSRNRLSADDIGINIFPLFNSLLIHMKCTSNMAAWFYAQFIDVSVVDTKPHSATNSWRLN